MLPLSGISGKSMMDRVVVNVGDQGSEIGVGIDELSFEIRNKQAAFSIVEFVEGLTIPIEKVRELAADDVAKPSKGFKPLEGWFRIRLFNSQKLQYLVLLFHPHHHMQMIRHQAVRISFCNRFNMVAVFLKKIGVVLIFPKQVFIAVSVRPDVIHSAGFEGMVGCAIKLFFRKPSKGSQPLEG